MVEKKSKPSVEKPHLHARNKHNNKYDFDALCATYPPLAPFVAKNEYGNISIDFFNADAVLALNKALLLHFYDIQSWDIPAGYLCPPIPSRADYIHYAADLLYRDFPKLKKNKLIGKKIQVLDLGTGANCVYPIIGSKEYGWQFVASELDELATKNAQKIVSENSRLTDRIDVRQQPSATSYFKNIVQPNEYYAMVVCNPPFFRSQAEANEENIRKVSNLTKQKQAQPKSSFGGKSNELWCDGGELEFIEYMMYESKEFSRQCLWFTTLVAKEDNLKTLKSYLKKVHPAEVEVIEMKQGNKVSRILAWSFYDRVEQRVWMKNIELS